MTADRMLLRGAHVVSMDGPDFVDGDVLIEGDKIAYVGPRMGQVDAETVDVTDHILIPGLIDTHRHLWQTAIRGTFADWSTLQYFHGVRLHMASMYRPEDTYIATLVGSLECLNNGVTTVIGYEHNVNTPDHAFAGAQAMRDSGIGGVYGMGFLPAPYAMNGFAAAKDYDDLLARLRDEFFSDEGGRLRLGAAPAELFVEDADVTEWQILMARRHGAQITLHANAVQNSRREIAELHRRGLLQADMVLVHCNLTDDDEYALIKGVGAAISAGVEVEIGMALGEPSIRDQRRLGLAPSLGVDSVGCCGGGIIGQARLAMQTVCLAEADAALARGDNPEALAVTSYEALEWATINGARALRMDSEIGSITVGKRADLVAIDTTSPDMAGWYEGDPAAAVISQSSSADIAHVLVAGKFVKRDGRLANADWSRQRALMDATKGHIAKHAIQPHGGLIPNPPPSLPEGHGW